MVAEVKAFTGNNIQDIPRALRTLADEFEQGKMGDGHNIAWVVDCGGGQIEVGLLGAAAEGALTAHFLFALAQRKLEMGGMNDVRFG